ncbi:hypothetical protein HK096_004946 [Nowakowskiella sp. JEL0078]|nr:hypothetical protein HK096_004946 [Nowakowskiella sp. JEL0078]
MLFEGERTSFEFVLENVDSVPINYLTISFTENSAYDELTKENSKDLELSEDAYERDVHDRSIRAFWVKENDDQAQFGDSKTTVLNLDRFGNKITIRNKIKVVIGVFGKRGCVGGNIKIDYGYIEQLDSENSPERMSSSLEQALEEEEQVHEPQPSVFYTRQLNIPILLTVQRALEPINMDVMPFSADMEQHIFSNQINLFSNLSQREILFEKKLLEDEENSYDLPSESNGIRSASEYCLFTFDIQNTWSQPFEVSFEVFEDSNSNEISTLVIHGGVTKRIIIPIRRINLTREELSRPIPLPKWKQFVVGKVAQFSPQEELERRAIFWLKESLVGGLNTPGRISAQWKIADRSGKLSLRSLVLLRSSVQILKTNEIEFSVQAIPRSINESPENAYSGRLGVNAAWCKVGQVIDLEWTIKNFTDIPAKLCLRVFPIQDFENGETTDNLQGRVVHQGSLQTILPELPSMNTIPSDVKHKIPVLFLSEGRFKFAYHVEDLRAGAAAAALAESVTEALRQAKANKAEVVDVPSRVAEIARKYHRERFMCGSEPFVVVAKR